MKNLNIVALQFLSQAAAQILHDNGLLSQQRATHHPGVERIALRILGEIGFYWACVNSSILSLRWWAVVVPSLLCIHHIDAINEELEAAAQEPMPVALRIIGVVSAMAIFHVSYGFYKAMNAVKNFSASRNLLKFVITSHALSLNLGSFIMPALRDMQATLFYNSTRLTTRIQAEADPLRRVTLLREELAPSTFVDTSGTRPADHPLSTTEKVALYVTWIFQVAFKAACIALPFYADPIAMLAGAILGYCMKDFFPTFGDAPAEEESRWAINPRADELLPVFQPLSPSTPTLRKQLQMLQMPILHCFNSLATPRWGPMGFGYFAGLALRYHHN